MISPSTISILGLTATGKTELALVVAQWLLEKQNISHVAIISVDSRQVYKGLELVSGADRPVGWVEGSDEKLSGPWWKNESATISWHGQSLLDPSQTWSVGQFVDLAKSVTSWVAQKNGMVILVGGTGLYHQRLWLRDWRLGVPPNPSLREELSSKSLNELQEMAAIANHDKWLSLNNSDRNNPRRLLRIIEQYRWAERNLEKNLDSDKNSNLRSDEKKGPKVSIGLDVSPATLRKRVTARVQARLAAGAVESVEKLVSKYGDEFWRWPAASATGLSSISSHLAGEIDLERLEQQWIAEELSYAKRQKTWLQKQPTMNWYQAEGPLWQERVLDHLSSLVY